MDNQNIELNRLCVAQVLHMAEEARKANVDTVNMDTPDAWNWPQVGMTVTHNGTQAQRLNVPAEQGDQTGTVEVKHVFKAVAKMAGIATSNPSGGAKKLDTLANEVTTHLNVSVNLS